MTAALLVLISIQGGAKPATQALLGAELALQRIRARSVTGIKTDSFTPFIAEIDRFVSASGGMSAESTAAGWMNLLSAWNTAASQVQPTDLTDYGDHSLALMVRALPRPEVWPLIRAKIATKPDEKQRTVLLMLFDRLLGDDASLIRRLEALRKPPSLSGSDQDFASAEIAKIELPAAVRTGNSELIAKVLTGASPTSSYFFFEGIPDVVGMVGVAKAERILRSIYKRAERGFDKINGEATRELSRKIILSDLANVKYAQWSLASGPNSLEYAIKLQAKFGLKEFSLNRNSEVRVQMIHHFLSAGKASQAVELISETSLPESLSPAELRELLQEVEREFRNDRNTPAWGVFEELSKRLGTQSKFSEQLDAALADSRLTTKNRRHLYGLRASLRGGNGDETGLVADLIAAAKLNVEGESDSEDFVNRLVAVANATGNRVALDAALREAEKTTSDAYGTDSVFPALVASGRFADAQRLTVKQATSPSRQGEGGASEITPVQLAEIYYRANRPEDLIGLLDRYPDWESSDLFRLLTKRPGAGYRDVSARLPLGFFAAWAFDHTGKKDLARHTLRDLLCFDFTSDEAYEMLNGYADPSDLHFYDDLARTDRFVTRPLMWKADLLRRLGRLAEAEKLARAAVALDPTDGDAGPNRRLMSYVLLSKILHELKNPDAETYDHIVSAVRQSEKADKFRAAGLLPQALALYREASATFSGAYCVEARIALTLADQGKHAESLEHFKRAYELMPASFGRIESLCLSCETAFEGSARRKLALETFQKMAKTLSKKPQVHYMLGRLYAESSQPLAAFTAFQRAVELDPGYFNAWKSMVELEGLGAAQEPKLKQAALTMLRLDPLELHAGYQGDRKEISDCVTLWRLYSVAYAALPPAPKGPLYPVHKSSGKGRTQMSYSFLSGPGAAELRRGPGAALAQNRDIANICNFHFWN